MDPPDKPTTKPKQRAWVAWLIEEIRHERIGRGKVLEALRELHAQLYNRTSPRGRLSSVPTRGVTRTVLELHRTTRMSHQEISVEVGVSIGRVSEIINGKRV